MQNNNYWESFASTLCRLFKNKKFAGFAKIIQESANDLGYKKVWEIIAACYTYDNFGKIEFDDLREGKLIIN